MNLNTEITGVERITIEGMEAALIVCDKKVVCERLNFVCNSSNEDGDTDIVLHKEFGPARLIWNWDGELMGLLVGYWNIIVSADHEGLVIYKEDEPYGDVIHIDMNNEWIDVLMIVRSFFALERAETCNYERFL